MASFISAALGVAAALIILSHPQCAASLFVMFCIGFVVQLLKNV